MIWSRFLVLDLSFIVVLLYGGDLTSLPELDSRFLVRFVQSSGGGVLILSGGGVLAALINGGGPGLLLASAFLAASLVFTLSNQTVRVPGNSSIRCSHGLGLPIHTSTTGNRSGIFDLFVVAS